jgi:NTE family protein
LLDGGLINPVPVSTCRALGADIVIAANLNADIMGRRFVPHGPEQGQSVHPAALEGLLDKVPSGIRHSISQIAPELLTSEPSAPGFFDVLANSINIMQDQITRSRLAGEPPHVMLTPRLAHMGLFDFQNTHEAIAEGHACVERALPDLRALI